MGFRDDDDAQRERAERLEQELRDRDAELGRKERELAELRATVAGKTEEAEPASPGSSLAGGTESLWSMAGWGERIGMVLAGIAGLVGAVVGLLGLAAGFGSFFSSAPTVPEIALPRHAATWWSATIATVRGAEGLPPADLAALAPGAPCTVTAELSSDGASSVASEITIVCGPRVIYPRTYIGPGTSGSCEIWEGEVATGEARFDYGLRCHDPGGSGRPALSIATREGTARVLAGPLEIDLSVALTSAEHAGEPLYVANTPRTLPPAAVDRVGHVTAVTGPAPHAVGAPCVLRVFAVPGGRYDCMVRLACDGRSLYGDDARNDGYNDCSEDAAGHPVRATDPRPSAEDTDPALELDVGSGTATVSDAVGGVPWTVAVALDAARE